MREQRNNRMSLRVDLTQKINIDLIIYKNELLKILYTTIQNFLKIHKNRKFFADGDVAMGL
jgi:hypothetical protein